MITIKTQPIKSMKYFSTFSGVGGFELGINKAYEKNKLVETTTDTLSKRNIEESEGGGRFWKHAPHCTGYSEIDKYAIQVYKKHFPKHTNHGDITKINANELPDFDLLVGGIPCQSWSIAGKRGGFEDERGNMWFQFSKILREKQPKFFIAENVKGILSHNGGKSMEKICEELCGCGYAIDFEVLNAKHFGVPQSRDRVFIIGIRLDLLDPIQTF